MKIDVLIQVNSQTISVKSSVVNYTDSRPALIALSKDKDEEFEQFEAVGVKITAQEMESDSWYQERDKGNRIYRVINPFVPQSFEPRIAAMTVNFYSLLIFGSIKPKRGNWRKLLGFDYFDLRLQIKDYVFVNYLKKQEFEKYLKSKVSRHITVEN